MRALTLLFTILPGVLGQYRVLQGDDVTVLEGAPVQLNCTYEGTEYSLQWYKQMPGRPVQHILSRSSSGHSQQEGVSMQLDTRSKHTSLHLSSARVHDSGSYFCAMEITTTSSVQPKLPDSPPAVYLLKPSSGSKNQTGSACLTTDFFPSDQVKVFINNKEGQRPPTLVQSGKRWSYGVVEWSSDPHDQPVNCSATYKKTKNYTYKGKDDVQNSCPVMSVDESFETDEKLNTLSLTVLGLKIIFIKSIAFNSLVTLKLWTH